MQAGLVWATSSVGAMVLLQINSGFAGQQLKRTFKIQALHLHDKAEHITTLTRGKVVPDLFFWTSHKAGSFFVCKWTKALPVASGPFKLYIFPDNILDAQARFNFVNCIHCRNIVRYLLPFLSLHQGA